MTNSNSSDRESYKRKPPRVGAKWIGSTEQVNLVRQAFHYATGLLYAVTFTEVALYMPSIAVLMNAYGLLEGVPSVRLARHTYEQK